ncbi:hypothetical protein Cri9333_3359 [Crinalium epipsammum PCC 9333]|uniref:DUF2281 domain-containing protein n=1 Tax=Crinalium epipsammum PCC 9333 TaxID=1173022 RepID=K9W1D8_9CYAN|nr:DUF2281 domain-containing protein [Crinalium epipsammum]AFZ14188.1 hypothetical protein Cri9333_3359 [Crinalium epipsammum PCC 9333]
MTQAINNSQLMLNEFQNLSAAQQQEVIDFIQFLQYKAAQKNVSELRRISAYEAAQQWAGCVDSGLGDLSTNKDYLEGFGKS